MQIEHFSDYQALSERACELILQQLKKKPKTLLCPATGSTPLLAYQLLSKKLKGKSSSLSLVMLDEWYGLDKDQEGSCFAYLQKNLITPLGIPDQQLFLFDSMATSPEMECLKMQKSLSINGPIDLLILGIGLNGHLGFNEPNHFLSPTCHVAELDDQTMQHVMIKEVEFKPSKGLTLGIGDILNAKKIILLINGSHKKAITTAFLTSEITTQLPASFLWLHPNVTCLIETNAHT